MRCPYCSGKDTQVKDSRPTHDNTAIRRRRACPDCAARFTTFERIQLRELTVLKRSGRKVGFDRDKLARSIAIALRKRPIDEERVERMISGIVRQLENSSDAEIPSQQIGELVIEALAGLDPVAYVRFASVYRDFREAADFEDVLRDIAANPSSAASDKPSSENATTDKDATQDPGTAGPEPGEPQTHTKTRGLAEKSKALPTPPKVR